MKCLRTMAKKQGSFFRTNSTRDELNFKVALPEIPNFFNSTTSILPPKEIRVISKFRNKNRTNSSYAVPVNLRRLLLDSLLQDELLWFSSLCRSYRRPSYMHEAPCSRLRDICWSSSALQSDDGVVT
jgi:hypothetical protein